MKRTSVVIAGATRLSKAPWTIRLLVALSGGALSWAANSYQPLFVVERSTNQNVVHYDAQIAENGELDPREPVVVYWVMAAKDGHRQALTFLEKIKAYGITVEPDSAPHSFRIALAAYRQRPIAVCREGDRFRAEAVIEGRRAYLKRIYVTVGKGMLFSAPKSIELVGTDIGTGESLHETISPGI